MTNLIAHRALDSYLYNENTKEAIEYCLNRKYIKGVEIDVRLTKDNKLVLIHDSLINRTSNGYGFVKNMTLKELKRYNFGTKDKRSKISTLEEVIKIVPNNKILLIEIKCFVDEINFVNIFYKKIKKYIKNNIYVMSFNKKEIEVLKQKDYKIKCGLLQIKENSISGDFDFIAISSYYVDKTKVFNKNLFIWGITSIKQYEKLVKKYNNAYFIVNYPFKYIKE